MKNYKQNPNKGEDSKLALKGDPISQYMATNLITFTPDTDIFDAIDTLLKNKISGAPVLNTRKEVVGMIDDKDCLNVLIDEVYHNQPMGKKICQNYMDAVFKTISIDSDIIDVASIFLGSTYKRLIVLDKDGKLAGQVSRRDILRAIQNMRGSTWHKKS